MFRSQLLKSRSWSGGESPRTWIKLGCLTFPFILLVLLLTILADGIHLISVQLIPCKMSDIGRTLTFPPFEKKFVEIPNGLRLDTFISISYTWACSFCAITNSIPRCLTRIFVCTSDCIEGQPCQMAHILNEQRFHKYISFSRTFVYREVLNFSHELVQLEVTLPRNCRLGPWCQWISDPCRVQQRYQLRKICFQVFRRDNGAEFQWTSRRWQLVIDK